MQSSCDAVRMVSESPQTQLLIRFANHCRELDTITNREYLRDEYASAETRNRLMLQKIDILYAKNTLLDFKALCNILAKKR